MSYVEQNKFLYIESGTLDEEDLLLCLKKEINKIFNRSYEIFINVVKNKHMDLLGYAYVWISDIEIFNVLVGLEKNGDERVIIKKTIIKKKSDQLTNDWADLVDEEIIDKTYLESLVRFDDIRIIKCVIQVDYEKENKILVYNDNVSKDFEYLKKFFSFFEEDKISKNYPVIELGKKNKNICLIKFSPRFAHTASFVINLVKKLEIDGTTYFFKQSQQK